jgi:hypothetical protein
MTQNSNVSPVDSLLQFTGTLSELRACAHRLFLHLEEMRWSGDHSPMEDSWYLLDQRRKERGQLHERESGTVLVLHTSWINASPARQRTLLCFVR